MSLKHQTNEQWCERAFSLLMTVNPVINSDGQHFVRGTEFSLVCSPTVSCGCVCRGAE